jgi:hypothetical protein
VSSEVFVSAGCSLNLVVVGARIEGSGRKIYLYENLEGKKRRVQSKPVNIVLEVHDNENILMCPTDRGNDPAVESDETERVDRERGTDGDFQS